MIYGFAMVLAVVTGDQVDKAFGAFDKALLSRYAEGHRSTYSSERGISCYWRSAEGASLRLAVLFCETSPTQPSLKSYLKYQHLDTTNLPFSEFSLGTVSLARDPWDTMGGFVHGVLGNLLVSARFHYGYAPDDSHNDSDPLHWGHLFKRKNVKPEGDRDRDLAEGLARRLFGRFLGDHALASRIKLPEGVALPPASEYIRASEWAAATGGAMGEVEVNGTFSIKKGGQTIEFAVGCDKARISGQWKDLGWYVGMRGDDPLLPQTKLASLLP